MRPTLHPSTARSNAPLSGLIMLCAVVCGLSTGAVFGKPAPKQPLPVDTIDARISVLQKRIDSLSASIQNLKQDSAKTLSSVSSSGTAESARLAAIDDSIAKKKTALAGLQSAVQKAKQDSTGIVARFKQKSDSISRDVDRISKQLTTLQAEKQPVVKKQEPVVDNGRTKARLQADIARADSACAVQQGGLAAIDAELDQLRRDSASSVKKIGEDRGRMHRRLRDLDSQIALCNGEATRVADSQASAKVQAAQKTAKLKEEIARMTGTRKNYADRLPEMSRQIATLGEQKADYIKTAENELRHYNELRNPLDSAVRIADAEVQALTQDKQLLEALHQKLMLDKQIAVAREVLDKEIQRSGSKSKTLDAQEASIEALLSQRDSLLNAVPGLPEREASFDNGAVTTKLSSVGKAQTENISKLAAAQGRLDRASKALTQFDQTHPVAKGPAPERIAMLDSLEKARKKEAIRMSEQSDSLAIQIDNVQKTITALAASLQAASAVSDSTLQSIAARKSSTVKNRSTAEHDSTQIDSANAFVLKQVVLRMDTLAIQKTAAQSDIAQSTALRDKAKKELTAIVGQEKQRQDSEAAEKARADSTATARQRQLAQLSADRDKSIQTVTALRAETDRQIKEIMTPAAQSATAAVETQKSLAMLQAQADSLRNLLLAAKKDVTGKVKAISAAMAAADRSCATARHAVENFKAERAERVALDKKLALRKFQEIYSLLQDKKIANADRLYKKYEAFLKVNLDDEHLQALKNTLAQMIADNKK